MILLIFKNITSDFIAEILEAWSVWAAIFHKPRTGIRCYKIWMYDYLKYMLKRVCRAAMERV